MHGLNVPSQLAAFLTAALLLLGESQVGAQERPGSQAHLLPVDTLLQRAERESRLPAVNNIAGARIIQVLTSRAASAARRDSLLDGLERMATTNPSERVRRSAVGYIALAGEQKGTRGVLARLLRIYGANTERSVIRLAIRDRMVLQAERRAAAQFLSRVVKEPHRHDLTQPDDPGDPRMHALQRLTEMGPDGREALQDLHRNSRSLDRPIQAAIQQMAAQGFPVRDFAANRRQP